MKITFGPEGNPHGTFDSFFDVFFDVRIGSLNGTIVNSGDLVMTSSGTPWGHDAPPGALLIVGVNDKLNGTDISQDFWPDPILEQHPTGAQHRVTPVPEPTTLIAGALLLLPFGASTVRFLRKNSAGKA